MLAGKALPPQVWHGLKGQLQGRGLWHRAGHGAGRRQGCSGEGKRHSRRSHQHARAQESSSWQQEKGQHVVTPAFGEQESSEQCRDIPSAAPGTHSWQHLRGATSATATAHQETTQAHISPVTRLSPPHISLFPLPPSTVAVGISGKVTAMAFPSEAPQTSVGACRETLQQQQCWQQCRRQLRRQQGLGECLVPRAARGESLPGGSCIGNN